MSKEKENLCLIIQFVETNSVTILWKQVSANISTQKMKSISLKKKDVLKKITVLTLKKDVAEWTTLMKKKASCLGKWTKENIDLHIFE